MDEISEVVVIVHAQVDPEHEAELAHKFAELNAGPSPDGLLLSELARGQNGEWAITSRWKDFSALQARRSDPQPPPATVIFESVGATETHEVWVVEQSYPKG